MHCHHDAGELASADRPIVLMGNPNVGKSALFSAFSGRWVDVSNYPGTTVEIALGKVQVNGHELPLIDTPGVQSLLPHSEDERVARDVLLKETPWAVVQVADSKNLRRALLLTFQLAEQEAPFVLALNMADEAQAAGIRVNATRLAQILGADVVPTVATRGDGLDDLRARLVSPHAATYRIRYDGAIEEAVARIVELLPPAWNGKRALALALLAGDSSAFGDRRPDVATLDQIEAIVAGVQERYEEPLGYVISRQRLKCADCILAEVYCAPEKRKVQWTDWLGRLMVHPLWGWFFLALTLFGLYEFVGVFGAGTLVDWVEGVFLAPGSTP